MLKKIILSKVKKNLSKKNFYLISQGYIFFKKIIINPFISILRFYKIYSPKYNIKKKIQFGNTKENIYFLKLLKKSKLYFEYGSGNSTLVAKELKVNFYSVESDKNFYAHLKKKIKKNYFLRDLGFVYYYSIPILFWIRKFFLKTKAKKYASDVLEILRSKKLSPDLILIDGRYRVLCALYIYNFFKINKKNFRIIIDDYKERSEYKVLEKFFVIKKIGRFGVAQAIKKNNTDKYIEKYSLDFR